MESTIAHVFGVPSVFKLRGPLSAVQVITEEEAAGMRACLMVKREASDSDILYEPGGVMSSPGRNALT